MLADPSPAPAPPLAAVTLVGPEATEALARQLAPHLGPGDTLLLEGPVGAGKSHFARALIQTLQAAQGPVEDVPSPSFTLVQIYAAGPLEIWHCDLYRLGSADELVELGLDEAFGTALCLIEWPERLGPLAPVDALRLRFGMPAGAPETRRVTAFGGPRWRWLAGLLDGDPA